MILTVTLNPAVDRTCRMESLEPGRVNRIKSVHSVAGGKGINVARVLRSFHMPAAGAGFLGGPGGRFIQNSMEEAGIECHFTKIRGETRTNTNILGEDGAVTELLEPGPPVTEKELAQFRKQFSGCLERCGTVVLSGSAPEGVPEDIYRQLIEECHAAGRRVLLDTSGELLREGAKALPDLVKPNRKELEYLAGRELPSREELLKEARGLVRSGVRRVVVSLGEEGLLYVDREQELYQPAKRVAAVNTVGCGDTVTASFCMSLLAGEAADISLRKASALAAVNAVRGGNGNISMEAYLELL
ncbi:MAG: 1-phosphofructokinase [Acetatifactor sp.]|nr:1-phosphofructokinase [Acetatifactor sp.]